MLKNTHQHLLMRVRTALAGQTDAALQALATELDAMLLSDSAERAAVSRRASRQGSGASGRLPSVPYAIETEPGGITKVMGAAAAHIALGEALAAAGAHKRLPKLASLQVSMSRNGHWSTLVDTDNGTVSITLRRLEPTGTTLALRKDRAKKTKTT